jgi:predicted outer membrane repeat protein
VKNNLLSVALSCAVCAGAAAQPGNVLVVRSGAPGGGDGLSWATAFNDLHVALDAAAASGGARNELWVAEGTYQPTRLVTVGDPASATFALVAGVSVYGGFAGSETARETRDPAAHPTVLTGDGLATRPFHVVTASGIPAGTALDGVTISGGYPGFAPGADRGGGLHLSNSSSLSVTGVTISGNSSGSGGGVYIASGSPVFTGCTISGNTATMVSSGGAGVLVGGGSPSFERCTFEGNETIGPVPGGGLRNQGSGTVTLRACRFIDNLADSGGAVYGQNLTLVNCLARGNIGGIAGSVQISLTNCTVIDNLPAKNGLWCGVNATGSGTLTNCIVWGNRYAADAGRNPQVWGNVTVAYSCVEPNTIGPVLSGTGLLRLDPLLDADGCSAFYSPCIDSGSNAALPAGMLEDLSGLSRFHDDTGMPDYGQGSGALTDMGALEFQGTTCYANCDRSAVDPILNVQDFACFVQRYISGDRLANCDGSTVAPTLNILDFACFTNRFTAGCP